jgi:hypothetical protein
VAGDSRLQFNDAVRECLANCYRTDLPVAALAEYVEVLKQRDWTASEIHKVEAAVLKILLAVVSKDERDDLVNRLIKPRGNRPATNRQQAEGGDSPLKDSDKQQAPGVKFSDRSSETARPRVARASGNVLPALDGFGSGDSTARRA